MNVLCVVGEKTFTQPGWLKAEAAVLAERHIYRTFTSATKEIFIKCQVHPGAAVCQTHILHPRTVWQKATVWLFLSSSPHERKRKKQYNYGFFKGQCEVLWWDARWVHCTFPQQNSSHFSAAFMKSPFWQKANITQIHSGLASRAPWWLSIPFSTLVLLQPFRGGLFYLSGRGGDVLSVCFNALHNAVRFATRCQINSGFVLSSLRGPIDDHFRCPSQSRCAVSIHISFMEFLAVQLHRLSEMLSLGPESSSGWMRQAESMHLDWITFPCSARNGLIGGFREVS